MGTFGRVSSLYIHIPFCKQACSYCDFHFSTNQKLRLPLLDAMTKEFALRSGEINGPIETVYFGGGSPSLLKESELYLIMESLRQHYDLSNVKEATIETNPDDHSADKLALWRKVGFNRLSIGIQSFVDRDLQFMNRAHNALEAQSCVDAARKEGFHSITIDLIYGIPGQTATEWRENVQKAIDLHPDHVSAYCLTVESKTALHHQLKTGVLQEKDDEVVEAEYLHLHHTLKAAGFDHYEISNFCKPGAQALHNSNYWLGKPYMGFGPSAHSFTQGKVRRWNVANNGAYRKAIQSHDVFWESETLSDVESANEKIMTGLRTVKGILHSDFEPLHWQKITAQTEALQGNFKHAVIFEDGFISIRPENWLLADGIIRSLMID